MGQDFTCALGRDSGVWCWGDNRWGRLGDGTVSDRAHPVRVCVSGAGADCVPLTGVVLVRSAGHYSCVVMQDKAARCWGGNVGGVLGVGYDDYTNTNPRRICAQGSGDACPELQGVVDIAPGHAHNCALLEDGTARCWGDNSVGALGDGTTEDRLNPVAVCATGSGDGCSGGQPLGEIAALYAQHQSTCALTASGDVLCWGDDEWEQLGDGTPEIGGMATHPQPVCLSGSHVGADCVPLDDVKMLSSRGATICALRNSGDVVCWGRNNEGQCGDGDPSGPTAVATPTVVCDTGSGASCVPLAGVVSLATAPEAAPVCALMDDGGIRCWGANDKGQLGGDSTTAAAFNPITVREMQADSLCTGTAPVLTSAVAVAVNYWHGCALTEQGRIYCWGMQQDHRLGSGDTTGIRCAAAPVCSSDTGLDCPAFSEAALRACGSARIELAGGD